MLTSSKFSPKFAVYFIFASCFVSGRLHGQVTVGSVFDVGLAENDYETSNMTFSTGGSTGTTSYSLTPVASVTAYANTPAGDLAMIASSILNYSFHIDGPIGVQVPVIVSGNIDVYGIRNYGLGTGEILVGAPLPGTQSDVEYDVGDEASFHFFDARNGGLALGGYTLGRLAATVQSTYSLGHFIGGEKDNLPYSLGTHFTFAFSYTKLLPSGTTVPVQIEAVAHAGIADSDSFDNPIPESILSSVYTVVDPMFTIDPSFADAKLFSIVVDNGVANATGAPIVSAVPESSTVGLWGAVSLIVGMAMKKRRTNRI